jgi:DMSO/TMAO reductase YedYZ heme-binding membrane subunit
VLFYDFLKKGYTTGVKLLHEKGVLVLILSIAISAAVYIWSGSLSSDLLRIIRMQQIYALCAFSCVYFALFLSPAAYVFKVSLSNSLKNGFIFSAFYFGFLHASISFFGQLGGFGGLAFLSDKYLIAIFLSFTGLIILTLLSLAAWNFFAKKYPAVLKLFPVLGYAAGILISIHALMLGTHFQDLSEFIPQIFFIAIALLLSLEALRLDRHLSEKFAFPKVGVLFMLVASLSFAYFFATLVPADSPFSLGIHSQHIELAKKAQQDQTANIPGMTGDRTKRFSVDFDSPEKVNPGEEVELTFKINDASSGNAVSLFQAIYEKTMHLIIVDKKLKYFNHIHPEQTANGFKIRTSFPEEGTYHLYIDFQPLGAIEQQFAFTLNAGNPTKTISKNPADRNLTKIFGDYEVTLSHPNPLKASSLSVGEQRLTFSLKDAKTKQPIKNLKPYLASFGHLVMINEDTYDYLHVHPANMTAPKPDENGGPDVTFLPLGLYGPIKPGTYKIFAQFNPGGNILTTDFTVELNK